MDATATRTRPWTRAVVLVAAGGAALSLLGAPAGAAPADRAPGTSAEAAQRAAQTAQQLTTVNEQVEQAQLTVAAEQKAAADASAHAATAQAAVDAYEPQLRAIAQAGIQDGGQSRVAAFLTSRSATQLVQRMTTLSMIADHTESVIAEVGRAVQAAQQAKAAADAASARATASLATLQQQQEQLHGQVASYRALYARLSTSERAAVTAAVAGPTLTAPSVSSVVSAAPSGAVALAIRTALSQQGKPYVFGATGPDGFDCSGLTAYAYAAAGITLPHSSKAQSTMGVPVSRADLQPGDLVYFYQPVSHVGLYIGNGMMVEARTFGQPVSVSSVDRAGYDGAVRIVH